MAVFRRGFASGKHFGEDFVYVMKNTSKSIFKIGCSTDPDKRLWQIQNQRRFKTDNIKLLGTFSAIEMNGAETVAQKAVQNDLRLVKVALNATDWFKERIGVRDRDILEIVEQAVLQQGYVCVIEDTSDGTFKIGSARNPSDVLAKTRRDFGHEYFSLLMNPVVADEMGGGKRAAYAAVQQELGLRRMVNNDGNAICWFENPMRRSNRIILETVNKAVEGFNESFR